MPFMKSAQRIISLALAITLSAQISVPAWAGEDEDQLAFEMGMSAAHNGIQELGKQGIADIIDYTLNAPTPKDGETTPGMDAIAYFNIALAGKNFLDAQNDEQRFWATLDGAVAGLTIAFPPAGAIAGLVLMAAKIANAVLALGHAKNMMELGERIQRDYEAIIIIKRQMGAADAVRFHRWMTGLQDESKAVAAIYTEMNQKCVSLSEKSKPDEFAHCLVLAQSIFPHAQSYLYYSRQLLEFRSEVWPLASIFEKLNRSEAEFRANTEKLQKEVVVMQNLSAQYFTMVGAAIARATVKEAVAKGSIDPVVRMRNECFAQVQRFNRRANLVLVRHGLAPSDASRAQIAQILGEESTSFNEGCKELVPSGQDPLFADLVTREKTLKAARAFLAEPVTTEVRN